MKKIISLLLSILLVMSVFTSCGTNTKKQKFTTTNDIITNIYPVNCEVSIHTKKQTKLQYKSTIILLVFQCQVYILSFCFIWYITVFESTNLLIIFVTVDKYPPELPLKSIIIELAPLFFKSIMADLT